MRRAIYQSNTDPQGGGNRHPALPRLLDAWTSYAINPRRWRDLIRELEEHSGALTNIDPNEFLTAFSRAESLSWRLRSDGSHAPDGFAYLLLDRNGRVLETVDDEELLRDYVNLDGERLQFHDAATAATWDAITRQAGDAKPPYHLLRLTSLDAKRARHCYVINAEDLPTHLATTRSEAVRALLIPAADASPLLRQTLQSSFGLTDAECRLTLSLVTGDSLSDAAKSLGVSVNTARNQLQSVFSKTGISRQSDLILVVAQLGIIVATSGQRNADGATHNLPEHRFAALPDGRRLAYRQYGRADGQPVLHLHETFGSSRMPLSTDDSAAAQGLNLVVPDRPGFGFSSDPAQATYRSIAQDLVALLDHLGWTQVTVSGYLSGAAYALELAATEPERVTHLSLVAGRSPEGSPDDRAWMSRLRARLIDHPWLLGSFFNILRNRTSSNLNRALLLRVYGEVESDRAFLETHPPVMEHLIETTLEAQSVSAAGVVADLRAYANHDPPNLAAITAPIQVWHGEEDLVADLDALRTYLAPKDPGLQLFPGEGSMVLFRHFDEWLASLVT